MALSSTIGLIHKLHQVHPITNDTYPLQKPSEPHDRPQEDADSYDFIIKEPDQDLINDTERSVNRFLRKAWSSSNQPNVQKRRLAGELLSPLIYHRHQVNNGIDDDVHVAVAVRLRDPVHGDFLTEVATLCDYLHSPGGIRRDSCSDISVWGIFGLEPVPRTTFVICWDSAFQYNMLVNSKPTVQSTLDGLRSLKAAAARVEWVRISSFLFEYYHSLPPGNRGLLGLVNTIMTEAGVSQEELQRQIYSVREMVGEILHFLAALRPRITAVSSTEWKRQVGVAKAKLGDVCRTLQLGAVSNLPTTLPAVVVMDLKFIKESFFTYREALDCFSNVLTCNEEIWTMYWRYTILTSVTSTGAGVAVFSLVCGALGAMPMAWLSVGVVACAVTAYPAYRNKEKANWCKQVDTCLRVCSSSVRDCEQLTGYLYLFHNRGQESLFYRNSSDEDMMEGFLYEIQNKTGRDPRQADFVRNGGYQAILQDRREALQEAIAKHEGILTKIDTMSS